MRHALHTTVISAVLIAGLVSPTLAAQAGEARPPTAADMARIELELTRVQQEVREQRQLILQLMQMHDALLKYVQMGGGTASPSSPFPPPPPSGPGAPPPSTGRGAEVVGSGVPAAASARGTISGKVRSSAALGEVYVYLDGPRSLASKPATIEIKQSARQFVPAVSVVQVGTRVLFPNEDKVFHNVFSRTPGDAFDLGTLKAGDRPNPVVLLKPGHVEVFCNIHSKMRADVLVVPNSYWTRVHADGSFQLSGVPVGSHRLVLWGPTTAPVMQRVELTGAGATVTLGADVVAHKPHLNKQGGAYESYDE